jgi:hypothetical protein
MGVLDYVNFLTPLGRKTQGCQGVWNDDAKVRLQRIAQIMMPELWYRYPSSV